MVTCTFSITLALTSSCPLALLAVQPALPTELQLADDQDSDPTTALITWSLTNQNADDAADSLTLTITLGLIPGEDDRNYPLLGTATQEDRKAKTQNGISGSYMYASCPRICDAPRMQKFGQTLPHSFTKVTYYSSQVSRALV